MRRIEAGFAAIAEIHRLMSFHEPDSDVSRLNRLGAETELRVDRATFAVLAQAAEISQLSDGVFDVTTAGRLVALGRLPRPEGAPPPDPHARWSDIVLTPPDHVAFRRPLWIDLGGIAKGFAVDRAFAAIAPGRGWRCVVNAGGDLRAGGPIAERILLRAPLHTPQGADGAAVLELQDGALASSGGQAPACHIDGRSGGIVGGRSFVSVTAPTCMTADALTKIVMARRAGAAAVLVRYGATAYLQSRSGWRTIGAASAA